MAGKFWKTVKIWSQKPHVVNKRLSGVVSVSSWKCVSEFQCWQSIVEDFKEELIDLDENGICRLFETKDNWTKTEENWTLEDPNGDECYVSIRKCLPKQPNRYQPMLEIEFVDFKLQCAVYLPIRNSGNADQLISPDCYAILAKESAIDLHISKVESQGHWLTVQVLPKLRKWMAEMDDETDDIRMESLSLVSVEAYNDLYQQLKQKYVPNISKIWPECTDPQKFIHEDVAIAAYLILLWRQEQIDLKADDNYKQSFIDIGCGNGLLVYLLTSEGYPGKGIDIRSRKIWSCYPQSIQLEVSTLVPSEETYFLDYDWLLGNHSDELTPWLPVVALQSSIRRLPAGLPTRYWVLPCCPFTFYGKFQRGKFNSSSNSSSSRYAEYLRFVAEVGRSCGFRVQQDRMRIPSTRRICFVGRLPEDVADWDVLIRSKSALIAASGIQSGAGFQPRSAVEPIRNCTRVDRRIQERIVNLTAAFLLRLPADRRHIRLPELVEMVSREAAADDFRALKSECGGVQTLLRNHSHIFVVQHKSVRFRSPAELSANEWRQSLENKKKKKRKIALDHPADAVKTKMCWFFSNHPDGCPLDQESCRYQHNPPIDSASAFSSPNLPTGSDS